jgi:hypothetical protein
MARDSETKLILIEHKSFPKQQHNRRLNKNKQDTKTFHRRS